MNRLRPSQVAAGAALACAFLVGTKLVSIDGAAPMSIEDSAADLAMWRSGLQLDALRVAALRRAADQEIEALGLQLGRVQTRILHLDSLATRLLERARLDPLEYEFAEEPALGGPEEPSQAAATGPLGDVDSAATRLSRLVDDRWRQLTVLEDLLRWRELNDAVRPEGRPVASGYLSSGFGARIDPFTGRTAVHKGIDFAARRGAEIVAVAAGIVVWSGPRQGYGETIEIDHGNGHTTRYAHNARNLVVVGDVVTRGQVIAELGSTGRATGPNLHFEVLQDGRAVDPLPYIE